MSPLLPCPGCSRHVRAGEPCPFCGHEASPSRAAPPEPRQRLSRAAILALGAAIAGSTALGCGESVETPTSAGSGSSGAAGGQGGGATTGTATTGTGTATGTGGAGGAGGSGGAGGAGGGVTSSGSGVGGIAPPYGSPPLDA